MKTHICAILTLLIFLSIDCSAAGRVLSQELDSLFCHRYPNPSEPGASVLIAKGGKIVYERQFGVADIKSKQKIDKKTAFNIASISKQFTVIGALKLIDENKLNLNDTLYRYFPSYKSELWHKVTLKHLMSQSSGIPDTRPRDNRNAMIYATDSTSAIYFETLDSLKFVPGSAYDYVNPTFILIARIIEKLSGMTFVDYQYKHIFDPLKMKSTYYFDPNAVKDNVAHSYDYEDGKWKIYEYGQETFFATRPDGGIYSTPRDLLKWECGLRDYKVVSEQMLREAYSRQTRVTGSKWSNYQNRENTFYGLGFFVDDSPSFPLKVYHTGDNGCFQAYLAKYPLKDVVIIVLENRSDKDRWSMVKEIDGILKANGLL